MIQPKDGIRDHDKGDGNAQADDRLQLAGGEGEAAVAHHRDALGVGPREMGPHRGGHRIAERAVRPVGNEPPPRPVQHQIGGEIGARRARIGDHYRVFGKRPLQFRDEAFRADGHLVGGFRQSDWKAASFRSFCNGDEIGVDPSRRGPVERVGKGFERESARRLSTAASVG